MRTIGLLGGSFNPAHAGHRQVSLELLHRYGLDEIWWLVSPGNPLKNPAELADYAARLTSAQAVARHPRLKVSDSEARLGTRYTVDTLKALQARYPQVRFVWIMGADNLAQFHRWKQWRDIAGRVDILVVDRKPWTHRALHSKAAQALRRTRSTPHQALAGGASRPPQWWYHFGRISPLSASDLRKTLGKKAFLLHTKN